MYFQPATIVVMPMVFLNIKEVSVRYTVMFLLVVITLYSFNVFFIPRYGEMILEPIKRFFLLKNFRVSWIPH
jgi:hypothetical protein